jgi:hypothetical protein
MTEESSYTEIAVAIGRIEEGIKSMRESIDGLLKQTRDHDSTLTRHEVEIARLKERQAPKIHWLTIVVGLIALAGFTLGILDRLYGN